MFSARTVMATLALASAGALAQRKFPHFRLGRSVFEQLILTIVFSR